MVLKVYDQNHAFKCNLTKLEDVKIEHDLESGDKLLYFTVYGQKVQNEYYIQTETDEYVVKEVKPSEGKLDVVCPMNLEELEREVIPKFTAENQTVRSAAALALAGTGWLVDTNIAKERSVQCFNCTPLEILKKIRDAFMCDISFDSMNKRVRFAESIGEYKGVYLMKGLNLKDLDPTYDSYDYYTRIIPVGEDGLDITEVHPEGKNYVENYQYSNKIRTLYWEDTSYEDPMALMEDAIAKLEDMSKPKISYSAKVSDLAKQSKKYKILEFKIGDTVDIIDHSMNIRDKQIIVKLTEYPDTPQNNTCELSNTVLTFEELQNKLKASADAWDDSTNADGTIKGVRVHGVEADTVSGIEIVVDRGVSNNQTVQGTAAGLATLEGKVGKIEATYMNVTEADIKYANIDFANVDIANIGKLFTKSGIINDLVTENGSITGELVGVTIKGDLIEANTLKAEKLVIKGEDGLYYKLNMNGEKVEAQQTDENSIDGSVITAKSITATKINVSDLVAFGATIASFIIEGDPDDDTVAGKIYSIGKDSKDSIVSGIYLDSKGNVNFGDKDQYLKYVDGKVEIQTEQYSVYEEDGVTYVANGNRNGRGYSRTSSLGFEYIRDGEAVFRVKSTKADSQYDIVKNTVVEIEMVYFPEVKFVVIKKTVNGVNYYPIDEDTPNGYSPVEVFVNGVSYPFMMFSGDLRPWVALPKDPPLPTISWTDDGDIITTDPNAKERNATVRFSIIEDTEPAFVFGRDNNPELAKCPALIGKGLTAKYDKYASEAVTIVGQYNEARAAGNGEVFVVGAGRSATEQISAMTVYAKSAAYEEGRVYFESPVFLERGGSFGGDIRITGRLFVNGKQIT